MKKIVEMFNSVKHNPIFLGVVMFLLIFAFFGFAEFLHKTQEGFYEKTFKNVTKLCDAKNFEVVYFSDGINVPSSRSLKQLIYRDVWEIGTSKSHFGIITRHDYHNSILYSAERDVITGSYYVYLTRNKQTIRIMFDYKMGLREVDFYNKDNKLFFESRDKSLFYKNIDNNEYYFYGDREEFSLFNNGKFVIKNDKKWWKGMEKKMIEDFFK